MRQIQGGVERSVQQSLIRCDAEAGSGVEYADSQNRGLALALSL